MIAFLTSKWGIRIAIVLAVFVAFAAVVFWHGTQVSAFEAATIAKRDDEWRKVLAEAEAKTRAEIRDKEAAAYQRGIEAEAKRQASDVAEADKAETIIREVISASPSANSCRYDRTSVDRLNGLRGQ